MTNIGRAEVLIVEIAASRLMLKAAIAHLVTADKLRVPVRIETLVDTLERIARQHDIQAGGVGGAVIEAFRRKTAMLVGNLRDVVEVQHAVQ